MACGRSTFLTIFSLFCAFYLANGQKQVIELNENNWKQMLAEEWMVEFYAPWCPACKALQPVWKEFATWSKDLGIKVAMVEVTNSPGLSGRFMVTGLPTIYHVIDGQFRQYKGTRDKESFISYIEEKKWMSVEPVPGWKSPNSIQMTVVSAFFKLSHSLRQLHTHLMEEFGLPTWGSYLIFAIATIILGAILGLISVCVIDFIYPPKNEIGKKADVTVKKTDKTSDNELSEDEIKGDDLIDDVGLSDSDEYSLPSGTEEDETQKEYPRSRRNRF